MAIRIVNQLYPPKKYFGPLNKYSGPPIGGVRGVRGTSNQPTYKSITRRFRICKIFEGPIYIVYVAACFRLVTPLDFQEEQEEQQQQAKRVLMVVDNPLDHGHGKKNKCSQGTPFKIITENKQTKNVEEHVCFT